MHSIKYCLGATLLMIGLNANSACWAEAAQQYSVDPVLLMAIGWKESRGHIGSIGPRLKDGNQAIGLMQINTIHLQMLSRYGITKDQLFDPCVSQKVGAFVLADCIKRFGQTWKAVGCYYGGPASKAYTAMRIYTNDVRRYYYGYMRLIQNGQLSSQNQIASTQIESIKMSPLLGTSMIWK